MKDFVFKILKADEWQELSSTGFFIGNPDDERDGFMHFSFSDQVEGTYAKHFSEREELVLLKVGVGNLGGDLKVERSKSGSRYPHLYRILFSKDVTAHISMTQGWRSLL